jgi:hypothetical protein
MAACTPSIHVFLGRPLFLLSAGIHSTISFGILVVLPCGEMCVPPEVMFVFRQTETFDSAFFVRLLLHYDCRRRCISYFLVAQPKYTSK